jgi:hypothetical protein
MTIIDMTMNVNVSVGDANVTRDIIHILILVDAGEPDTGAVMI